jgi:hypothetical protein
MCRLMVESCLCWGWWVQIHMKVVILYLLFFRNQLLKGIFFCFLEIAPKLWRTYSHLISVLYLFLQIKYSKAFFFVFLEITLKLWRTYSHWFQSYTFTVQIFLLFFQYISCQLRWWACCHWIYDGHINNYILKSQISNVISILLAPYNLWPHTIIFWILKSKIVKHWTERRRSWLGWVQVYRIILNPFQIIVCLSFFTPTLTTRLIQKICANIVKFKSFLKNFC